MHPTGDGESLATGRNRARVLEWVIIAGFLLSAGSCAPLFAVFFDEPIVSFGPIHTFIYYVLVPAVALAWIAVGVFTVRAVLAERISLGWLLVLPYALLCLGCLGAGRVAYQGEPWYWWKPSSPSAPPATQPPDDKSRS